MPDQRPSVALPLLILAVTVSSTPAEPTSSRPAKLDALRAVTAYADCLLEHGRDTYGTEHSPLFAEALDRHTLKLLEGEALQRVAAIPFDQWGIRPHDRMLTAANPMHCENLYQVLYALTTVTGQKKYAVEADRSLKFFFQHCQSPATGLFYWGEHAGWDLIQDRPMEGRSANLHEFYRPWVLWDRSYQLAPAACRKFFLGLWEHQIGDQTTGQFSRHAAIAAHGPRTDAPYARHAGTYIATWAKAYQLTREPILLKAIEVVLEGQERNRREDGLLAGGSLKKGSRRTHDLGLAVSLGEAAPMLPEPLAARLRDVAQINDGDLAAARVSVSPDANLWSAGYGASGGQIASAACLRLLRYRQNGPPAYKDLSHNRPSQAGRPSRTELPTGLGTGPKTLVLDTARQYLTGPINFSFPVHPGTVGNVIQLLLDAHELTAEKAYLARAEALAAEAVQVFTGDGCPLPKASHLHDHYEAVTGADTLMMALLNLWARQQTPPRDLGLQFTDR